MRRAGSALLLVLLCSGGCGGQGEGPVLARVGGVEIHRAAVDRWARVIERGGSADGISARLKGSPRQLAVAFLISSRWLAGEAAAQGAPVSDRAVERVVAQRRAAIGEGEFEAELRATGQTLADVRLEIAGELASASIRRKLAARAAAVSREEIEAYYRRQIRHFKIPETRVVDLLEKIPSRTAAATLVADGATGERFRRRGYHEVLQRGAVGSSGIPGKAALVRAIFAAPVGVVSRPMPLNHAWTVFVVRRITPASARPLAQVQGTIAKRLTAARLRGISREFARAYQARWRARTSCRAGYIVPGCAQYAGPLTLAEDPSALGSASLGEQPN